MMDREVIKDEPETLEQARISTSALLHSVIHFLHLKQLRPGSHSRSRIKRCALRRLFLSLEILSLSKSRRVPLAALQVAFRILLHSMPPSSCVYFFILHISYWLSMAVKILCHQDHFSGVIHHSW
jgi:hypothetical protein